MQIDRCRGRHGGSDGSRGFRDHGSGGRGVAREMGGLGAERLLPVRRVGGDVQRRERHRGVDMGADEGENEAERDAG